MTIYTDIPETNKLYQEQQQVQAAIYHLEHGGAIINMSVSPSSPPPPPGEGVPPAMTVIIPLLTPNPDELIASTVEALKARDAELTQELADLGIVWPRKEP